MFRLLLAAACVLAFINLPQLVSAQELITATPVRINIPTGAAPAVEIVSTPTITRTPTQTAVMLEAKADAGDVNVRAEADIESDRLGSIRAGEFYPVLGRYFRWIQFQYDSAPTGRAWVFDELVNIIGDANTIPDLSEQALPTEDPAVRAATETQAAVTLTPGGLLTSTAESRILAVPAVGGGESTQEVAAVLPTFTYPPDIVAAAPTEAEITTTTSPLEQQFAVPSDVPPLVPILLLGAGGMLGLVVSWLRR